MAKVDLKWPRQDLGDSMRKCMLLEQKLGAKPQDSANQNKKISTPGLP